MLSRLLLQAWVLGLARAQRNTQVPPRPALHCNGAEDGCPGAFTQLPLLGWSQVDTWVGRGPWGKSSSHGLFATMVAKIRAVKSEPAEGL